MSGARSKTPTDLYYTFVKNHPSCLTFFDYAVLPNE